MKCPDKDLTDGLHDMWEDLDRKDRAKLRRYSHVETILQPPTGIPLKALPKKMPGEKKCPKCGSEMREWAHCCNCNFCPETTFYRCSNELCGHEEKLEGEK
jgi:hypothetical protein